MPACAVHQTPPGAPKKQVKKLSRLASFQFNGVSKRLFNEQPDSLEKPDKRLRRPLDERAKKILKRGFPSSIYRSGKVSATPLKAKTVLAEIEKNSELKKFYDQLPSNAYKVAFLRQYAIKHCTVCDSEFVSNFKMEYPEVNGLPKPDPDVCDDADLYLQSHPEESFYYRWANY